MKHLIALVGLFLCSHLSDGWDIPVPLDVWQRIFGALLTYAFLLGLCAILKEKLYAR